MFFIRLMRSSDKERAQRARTGRESPYAPDRIYYRLGICGIRGQSRFVIQKIRESLKLEWRDYIVAQNLW